MTDAAWPSSARVVRCWVKSRNERNPCRMLFFHTRLPGPTGRKVGMTSGRHGSYTSGHTRPTMGSTMGSQIVRWSKSHQNYPQFGLRAETRPHEVGIASNGRSAHCREYVPGSCTHRPSNHESWECPTCRLCTALR